MNAVLQRKPSQPHSYTHTRYGFMHALSVMAKVITGRFGLRVVFYDGPPKTDNKTIWLPHLPAGSWVSELVRILFRGHLFHEMAHIFETTFDIEPRDKIERTALFHDCANALEDPRVEIAFGKKYPYVRSDLEQSYEIGQKRGTARTGDDGPEDALVCVIGGIGFVEYAQYPIFKSVLETASNNLAALIGNDKVLGLQQLIRSRFPDLACTLDVLDLTREVFDYLDIKPNGDEQDDKGDGTGKSDANDEPQKGGQGSTGASSGDPTNDDPTGGDDGEGDETGSQPANSDRTKPSSGEKQGKDDIQAEGDSGQQGKPFKFDPDASAGEGTTPLTDIWETFQEQVDEEASLLQRKAYTTAQLELKTVHVREGNLAAYQAYLAEGMKAVGAIASRFMRLLSIMKAPTTKATYSGRLRSSRAYRYALGDTKLFKRKQESKVPLFAMSLVGDFSSSMKGVPAKTATKATAAVGEAARRLGIPCEVSGFNSRGFFLFQSFSEQPMAVRHRIAQMPVMAGGSTPLAEAIYKAALRLVQRKEERKLLIVFTDGDPDNEALTEDVIKELEATPGVDVIGVGIGSSRVRDFFPLSVVVDSVDELGQALFAVLDEIILKKPH